MRVDLGMIYAKRSLSNLGPDAVLDCVSKVPVSITARMRQRYNEILIFTGSILLSFDITIAFERGYLTLGFRKPGIHLDGGLRSMCSGHLVILDA